MSYTYILKLVVQSKWVFSDLAFHLGPNGSITRLVDYVFNFGHLQQTLPYGILFLPK